jgi:hypothetical protein
VVFLGCSKKRNYKQRDVMKKIILVLFLMLIGISVVGAQEYSYWIEDDGGTYSIWTKINISAGETKTIYVQKQDGYSPDGDSVFEFFDDFDNLNGEKWDVSGDISVSDGLLYLGNTFTVKTIQTLVVPYIVEASLQYPQGADANGGLALYREGGYVSFWYSGHVGQGDYSGLQLTGDFGHTWGHFYVYDFKKYGYIVTDATTIAYTELFPDDSYSFNQQYNQVGFYGGNAGIYVDYIFVRKYADQEPTVSVEQISDDTWKITISNPNSYDLTDFQVKINGTDIVSSKTDSLFITDSLQDFYISTDKTTYALSQTVNLTLCSD